MARQLASAFQSVERICVPSNTRATRCDRAGAGFNPSNGFVCLRTPLNRTTMELFRRVSIRRTDLCAFEHHILLAIGEAPNTFQSVERICVPSNVTLFAACPAIALFQSVERICVPSNAGPAAAAPGVADRFNPSNGFVCLRTNTYIAWETGETKVSIRRTDLCAFELPSGALLLLLTGMFQSVERICVPSNSSTGDTSSWMIHGFNPSNGFVCLRTARR